MTRELCDYWVHNRGTASPAVVCDAFKPYTRGQYKVVIGKVRKEAGLALEEAKRKVQALESHYVDSKDVEMYKKMQITYKEIALMRATSCRKLILSQSQRIF